MVSDRADVAGSWFDVALFFAGIAVILVLLVYAWAGGAG